MCRNRIDLKVYHKEVRIKFDDPKTCQVQLKINLKNQQTDTQLTDMVRKVTLHHLIHHSVIAQTLTNHTSNPNHHPNPYPWLMTIIMTIKIVIKSKNVLLLHLPHHYHSTTMAHRVDHQSQPSVLSDPHHPQINTILCQRAQNNHSKHPQSISKSNNMKGLKSEPSVKRHVAAERLTVPGDFKTEIVPHMAMKRATDGFKWFYNVVHYCCKYLI